MFVINEDENISTTLHGPSIYIIFNGLLFFDRCNFESIIQ